MATKKFTKCAACVKGTVQATCDYCRHAIKGREWRHVRARIGGGVISVHSRCCVEHDASVEMHGNCIEDGCQLYEGDRYNPRAQPNCAEHPSAQHELVCLVCLERDDTMREFVGWLSADIPELHAVEVPLLAESLDRFLAAKAVK